MPPAFNRISRGPLECTRLLPTVLPHYRRRVSVRPEPFGVNPTGKGVGIALTDPTHKSRELGRSGRKSRCLALSNAGIRLKPTAGFGVWNFIFSASVYSEGIRTFYRNRVNFLGNTLVIGV